MKEKVKRILDLVRAGKLSLDDAAPLLAALNSKLALQGSDRELIESLLGREELGTEQIAEHLLLLRGVKDTPPAPPQPPRPPTWGGWEGGKSRWGTSPDELGDVVNARLEALGERLSRRAERLGSRAEERLNAMTEQYELHQGSSAQSGHFGNEQGSPRRNRILHVEVESENGDNYEANLPVSLAPHLHKLIPPYGQQALERAGFTLEGLRLIIESEPPSGVIVEAEDQDGNSIEISIK